MHATRMSTGGRQPRRLPGERRPGRLDPAHQPRAARPRPVRARPERLPEDAGLRQLGFTGVNPWERTRAAKLADGTWRYQYEDVTTATGIPAAALQGVRSWIDAPYHSRVAHVGTASKVLAPGVRPGW
jgi:hypothetical protein